MGFILQGLPEVLKGWVHGHAGSLKRIDTYKQSLLKKVWPCGIFFPVENHIVRLNLPVICKKALR